MRTIAELAKEALDVQNASNLSGLIQSWSESIRELRENLPNAGTDEINRHPINALWSYKVVDLTGANCFCTSCSTRFARTYNACQELAKGK
jgi:hypothetical protein